MELRRIDEHNVWPLVRLAVRPDQAGFVATNAESLIEAYVTTAAGRPALPFGLYEGEEPVGFVMLGYGASGDPDEPACACGSYCLWRLMIDARFQGRGLGRAALDAVLALLRTRPCGPADTVWLSYEPENAAARALYHRAGFRENGARCGGEIVAVRALAPE